MLKIEKIKLLSNFRMCSDDSFQFNKKDIERLIEEKNASISYGKPKEKKSITCQNIGLSSVKFM